MKKPLIVAIAGPTGSGKTALAIEIAQRLQTEIVSFDSRQLYRELGIAVAKPSAEELGKVPHHFISTVSIHDTYNAGMYEKEALEMIECLFKKHPIIVAVGGTGLYLKAIVEGLDAMDSGLQFTDQQTARQAVKALYDAKGLTGVQDAVLDLDPEAAATIEMPNTARVMRALELLWLLKKPLSEIRKGETLSREFDVKVFGIALQREELYRRIETRVEIMLEQGLEVEARSMFEFRHLNALKTVGYNEWFAHFEGEISREKAIEKIKQHTRNYAKRQLTWFNNTMKTEWLAEDQAIDAIFAGISEYV